MLRVPPHGPTVFVMGSSLISVPRVVVVEVADAEDDGAALYEVVRAVATVRDTARVSRVQVAAFGVAARVLAALDGSSLQEDPS